MQTVYSKLTLVSIDKHQHSKSKYSQTSAQATLSSKEPQCPQTSSGTATGHRDTCPMPTGIISLLSKDNLGFICCILERKSRGWDACLESLVMMTSCFLSSLLDTHQKDEHHTLLTCQCDIFTGQHTPPSALVLHKLQQVHFISHLALYTFIALEQMPMPSIIKML